MIGETSVLGYFLVAQDARRALNGLQRHCGDLMVLRMAEPLAGRSWCLTGRVRDPSEMLMVTTIIERWNGSTRSRSG